MACSGPRAAPAPARASRSPPRDRCGGAPAPGPGGRAAARARTPTRAPAPARRRERSSFASAQQLGPANEVAAGVGDAGPLRCTRRPSRTACAARRRCGRCPRPGGTPRPTRPARPSSSPEVSWSWAISASSDHQLGGATRLAQHLRRLEAHRQRRVGGDGGLRVEPGGDAPRRGAPGAPRAPARAAARRCGSNGRASRPSARAARSPPGGRARPTSAASRSTALPLRGRSVTTRRRLDSASASSSTCSPRSASRSQMRSATSGASWKEMEAARACCSGSASRTAPCR